MNAAVTAGHNRSFSQWRLAMVLAGREARAGFGGFRIFLICLALGVGAITAVGLLMHAFQNGLIVEGRTILGGDVELTLTQRRAENNERQFLKTFGKLSEVASLRAMMRGSAGKASTLVEIKAIDQAYPLFGKIIFDPAEFDLSVVNSSRVIAVDAILLSRLGLKLNDKVKIGDGEFTIGAVVKNEPDRIATGLSFGPRVLMSNISLAATGLVKPGSLVRWRYRVRLPTEKADMPDLIVFHEATDNAFPNAGWRVKDRTNSAPRIKRFIDRLAMLLTFVSLTALVVGGVGVGTAAKTYLDGRIKTIAMLKCLGAPGDLIFKTYLIHLLRLVVLGSVAGLVLGSAVTIGVGPVLQSLVALPAKFSLYWPPLLVAAVYGLSVTLMFALWSLGSARAVPAAALFRARVQALPARPGVRYIAGTLGFLCILVFLTFWQAHDVRFAAIYAGGVIGSFILFWLLAKLIIWAARHGTGSKLRMLRLALLQLRGAGLTTISSVISLGLGLTLLVALTLIEGNFVRHLLKELPSTAPSFFFVDIQLDQLRGVEKIVRNSPQVEKFDHVPMLRGRIIRLNDIPAEKISAAPNVQWVLSGDRGITYAAKKPGNTTLTEGEWWPDDYHGPPKVSFAADIAHGLGLKLGDKVTVNVLGREITAEITSLRNVEWGSLEINFVMVFSPDPVARAPHTYLATLAMAEKGEVDLMSAISLQFPNITMVRVREILQSLNDLLEKMLFAARLAAGLTLFVGVVVLIGALASSQRARRKDAVILKTLGLTRPELMRIYMLEHGLLGIATGLVAAACGTIFAYGLVYWVFQIPWAPMGYAVPLTVVGAVVLTIALGLVGTWRVLGVKPARLLQDE